jgi:hypothetical protein
MSQSSLQSVECYRYGNLALNCSVALDSDCTVVGVRETRSGEIRFSHPFGYTICTAVGPPG